jgi:hypothetical protein
MFLFQLPSSLLPPPFSRVPLCSYGWHGMCVPNGRQKRVFVWYVERIPANAFFFPLCARHTCMGVALRVHALFPIFCRHKKTDMCSACHVHALPFLGTNVGKPCFCPYMSSIWRDTYGKHWHVIKTPLHTWFSRHVSCLFDTCHVCSIRIMFVR